MSATLNPPPVRLPIKSTESSPPTDEELLLGYRETGDPDLFSQLVRRYERELFSYLRRKVGDAEMAEDAFQATFLQVHLKCQQFEPGRAVRPWLYTVATNQAIDAQRRSRRHRMVSLDRSSTAEGEEVGKLLDLLVSQELTPSAELSKVERKEWIEKAVAELPEPLRDVIQLIYFQNMKYREAADSLGIPVGTAKSRMHAAVAKLVEAWNQSQAESP